MKVREHSFNDLGWCVHCGAATWERIANRLRQSNQHVPETDERECLWRDAPAPIPEGPRILACEDQDFIADRLRALEAERLANYASVEEPPPDAGAYC